jgi:hypothetical protein
LARNASSRHVLLDHGGVRGDLRRHLLARRRVDDVADAEDAVLVDERASLAELRQRLRALREVAIGPLRDVRQLRDRKQADGQHEDEQKTGAA